MEKMSLISQNNNAGGGVTMVPIITQQINPINNNSNLNNMVRVPGSCSEICYKGMRFIITERPSDINMTNFIKELLRFRVTVLVNVCGKDEGRRESSGSGAATVPGSYHRDKLEEIGIEVFELPFPDGSPPPQEVIQDWFNLLRRQFGQFGNPGGQKPIKKETTDPLKKVIKIKNFNDSCPFIKNVVFNGDGGEEEEGVEEGVVGEGVEVEECDGIVDEPCSVGVHCLAGLGRAPVLVCLALIELGMKWEDAVQLIREKRRGAFNAKQISFLESYHRKQRKTKFKLKKGSEGFFGNFKLHHHPQGNQSGLSTEELITKLIKPTTDTKNLVTFPTAGVNLDKIRNTEVILRPKDPIKPNNIGPQQEETNGEKCNIF